MMWQRVCAVSECGAVCLHALCLRHAVLGGDDTSCLLLTLYPRPHPAGNITLSFSYPVQLRALAAALAVVTSPRGARQQRVQVSPCPAVTPTPLWQTAFTGDDAEAPRDGGSGLSTATGNSAIAAELNSTCAVVRLLPGLEAGTAAVLRLPRGARYSPVAGPVRNDTDVQVWPGGAASRCCWCCCCCRKAPSFLVGNQATPLAP